MCICVWRQLHHICCVTFAGKHRVAILNVQDVFQSTFKQTETKTSLSDWTERTDTSFWCETPRDLRGYLSQEATNTTFPICRNCRHSSQEQTDKQKAIAPLHQSMSTLQMSKLWIFHNVENISIEIVALPTFLFVCTFTGRLCIFWRSFCCDVQPQSDSSNETRTEEPWWHLS